jgi:hypothetical protein
VGAIDHAGQVSVLYGSASVGLQATSPDDQVWNQDTADVEDMAEADDEFGKGLRAGDFDDDGNADLAIGAWIEDVGSVLGAGAAAVLYGSSGGLQATSRNDLFLNQDVMDIEDTAETADRFGFAVE